MQIVNLLPHERYDKFVKQLEKLDSLISSIDDHSSCDNPCLWRTLHSDIDCILEGNVKNVVLTSADPEALQYTRSVLTQAQANQKTSVEARTKTDLKTL